MSGWIVGIDAGGTASRALARQTDTGETRAAEADGANWTVHGRIACRERLEELVRRVLPASELPNALALCLAGYYPPDHALDAAAWAAEAWPKTTVQIEPDYVSAWAGAFGGGPGVVVIAGTGSIAYGRNAAGREARAGGWGPLFGDEGSAYWLGKRLLKLVAREEDAGKPPSPLTQALLSDYPSLGMERRSWLRGIYRDDWRREQIAAIASILSNSKLIEPSVAEILNRAGEVLAEMAGGVMRRLDAEALPVTLLGGVGLGNPLVSESFKRSLSSGLEAVHPVATPVEGALQIASAAFLESSHARADSVTAPAAIETR